MKAELHLQLGTIHLSVDTDQHPVANSIQQTRIMISSSEKKVNQVYPLGVDERKALAAFLLSIPDIAA